MFLNFIQNLKIYLFHLLIMSNFFSDKRNYNNFLDKQSELYKLQVEEENLRLHLQEITSKLKKCKEDLTPQLPDIKEDNKNAFTLGMEAKINMIKFEEELANCQDEERIKPKIDMLYNVFII